MLKQHNYGITTVAAARTELKAEGVEISVALRVPGRSRSRFDLIPMGLLRAMDCEVPQEVED